MAKQQREHGTFPSDRDREQPDGGCSRRNCSWICSFQNTTKGGGATTARCLTTQRNGGFGAVPAWPAVVASLEKRLFRAGGDHDGCRELGGCAICLDEEGQELSVMPCSQAHSFHTQCITMWLGQSNLCPPFAEKRYLQRRYSWRI
ncbi:hypothetical protein EJB05_02283, partial [Eragrostis curvula]